ncbi:MAG: hypothetical protein M3501_11075 [Actinomycetota bacterium]|nr:hypothetical protein [Actinomycetota bacterium]
MSFGQSSSAPPASAKQVDYLQSLVRKAGFADFREARHPLGLTQRQAAGKFSRREASELIDQLLGNEDDDSSPATTAGAGPAADALRHVPAEMLAAELLRRGWRVSSPERAAT